MKKVLIACLVVLIVFSASISAFAVSIGDVNNDGTVTAADARIVLRASAKLEEIDESLISSADVNSDGSITAADARMVLRVAAKIDVFEEPSTQEPTTSAQPDISIAEYEHEIKPGETKVIVFSVSNIEDYYITLDCDEGEARDFTFDCKKYDDYAEVYVTAKEVLLCNIPVGSENAADFKLTVSLLDKSYAVVDSENVKIFSKYSDEEKAKGFSITQFVDGCIQYNYADEACNIYFSLANDAGDKVATYGRMYVTINDKEGDTVYSGEHDFTPDSFAMQSIKNKEESLYCCISIPFSEFAGEVIYEGEIILTVVTPWINWDNIQQVRFSDIKVQIQELMPDNGTDNNTDLTDPSACIDYGHLVNSGLCMRCSSYITSDLSLIFGDENSGLLPAETTCNIIGQYSSATINRITNVYAVKNYYGKYDITVTAEVDVTTYLERGDNGFFTVSLIDAATNTSIQSGQINYSGYGIKEITFSMSDVTPGTYAIMFLSIDIGLGNNTNKPSVDDNTDTNEPTIDNPVTVEDGDYPEAINTLFSQSYYFEANNVAYAADNGKIEGVFADTHGNDASIFIDGDVVYIKYIYNRSPLFFAINKGLVLSYNIELPFNYFENPEDYTKIVYYTETVDGEKYKVYKFSADDGREILFYADTDEAVRKVVYTYADGTSVSIDDITIITSEIPENMLTLNGYIDGGPLLYLDYVDNL